MKTNIVKYSDTAPTEYAARGDSEAAEAGAAAAAQEAASDPRERVAAPPPPPQQQHQQPLEASAAPVFDPTAAPEPDSDGGEPKFHTDKERECWRLYRKMCEKGITVSYDTVLRGMLTPTEYRLRRRALLSSC